MAVTASGKDKITTGMRLYVGGYDLSGDMMTFSSADMTYDTQDMTGWSQAVRNNYALWATSGIMGFQALMNDATAGAFARLKRTAGAQTGTQVSLCFGGAGAAPAVPDPAYLLPAVQMGDSVNTAGAGILQGDFLPDAAQYPTAGLMPMGVVLRGDTALSATLAASSANSHDNAGSTANGWHANLHVLSTASGNFTFKIRHSADDSAWADLGTFVADGSAITSETLSATGTVNQYIAFDAARVAGTVTVIVTFARN